MTDERLTWVQVVRIPAGGVTQFCAYEDVVLPLLAAYGGSLDARYRGDDGCFEVHVLSFASPGALETFRRDDRRLAVQHLLVSSGAAAELVAVNAVR